MGMSEKTSTTNQAAYSRTATYVKGIGFVLLAVSAVIWFGGGLGSAAPLIVVALLVVILGELMDIRHSINRRA